ncbi:putative acyl transferase acyl hydrolase lysophospholipase [Ceratocystis lukuohia]|uniref:Acyl transferase acyl hydrolase lysophospholipase n=1 Tax=Ceratocystis lukuohia TaxID=2019550 RepID=A0ABR4M9C5_9PEZI
MSSNTQPGGNDQPFKILSLDDGGVCGLSGLLILEKIMQSIQEAQGLPEVPKPCDSFDLIGGTGTGGIIAIMLGRLRMPIGDCIAAYKEIAKEAFTPSETLSPRLDLSSATKISTMKLENAMKKAIRENCPIPKCVEERKAGKSTTDTCQHENQKFTDQKCVKTVVLATTKADAAALPMLFKTYQTTARWSECKVWEVGRATSAMVGLFRPIKLGRNKKAFMNSSFGHSNPCKVLIDEAATLSDRQEKLILSIGMGLGDVIEIGDTGSSVEHALKTISTSSKGVADELETKYCNENGIYYRFNAVGGLGAIASSDLLDPSKAAAHAKNYLDEKQNDIKRFAKILTNGSSTDSGQPERPDDAGAVDYIPFHENPNFVGRAEILSKLNDKLFNQAGFQEAALVGLGGMGKTQVALKLAYAVKVKHTGYSVFWLTAASMDGYRNSCKALAGHLNLETDLNLKTDDSEDPRILVMDYLEAKKDGKWLLIIDNVDDTSLFDAPIEEDRITGFLPESEKGRIVYITRSKEVSWLALGRNDALELEEMPSEELATILMRGGVKGSNNEPPTKHQALIDDLLNQLCHFPLAVAQAADYMAVNQISIAEYLELLRESGRGKIELLEHFHLDDVHLDKSQGAVATTWVIAFQQIQKASPDAVNLLRFIAKVDSKAIPQRMLPGSDKKKATVDAIGMLLRYGFIRKQKTADLFDMHSLVHLMTQLWSKGLEDEEEHSLAVLDHMTSIFPSDELENRFLWGQYLSHALRVAEFERHSDRSMAELTFKVGRCLDRDGDSQGAVRMLEHVVGVREESLAADHPDYLTSLHDLANAYYDNGQMEEAISMLEYVLGVQEESLTAGHHNRLVCQHDLANAYWDNGQIEKAVSMLEHVVRMREETLAADHPSRLESQHNLANAYRDNGQIEKAVSILEHVVGVRKGSLAVSHPSLLESQHDLANAYCDNGQVEKAISMLEHMVRVQKESLAADHPSCLSSQRALAVAYRDNGQIKKSIAMLEHVVRIREETLAPGHPDRLASQHALAVSYCGNDQPEKAVSILEHVVRVREEYLVAEHPSYLTSLHDLANAHCDNGQMDKAISMLEYVVGVREKFLAVSHPDRLTSQHALGEVYRGNGQIQQAISILEHVVRIREETLAPGHPSRIASQEELAEAYIYNDEIDRAISMLERTEEEV